MGCQAEQAPLKLWFGSPQLNETCLWKFSRIVAFHPTGITFVMLQLSFKLASLVTTPIYTKIYQATLDTFPGFVFMLSSIFTVLSMIPIR